MDAARKMDLINNEIGFDLAVEFWKGVASRVSLAIPAAIGTVYPHLSVFDSWCCLDEVAARQLKTESERYLRQLVEREVSPGGRAVWIEQCGVARRPSCGGY
jgi:hypothetical protein